jgi:hypothetical protein
LSPVVKCKFFGWESEVFDDESHMSAQSSVLCRLTCALRHASISPWRNAP